MDFKTIEELRFYLTQDDVGSRHKFALKLFLVLQFTYKNPLSINVTGANWLRDGFRFAANSQILGQFINLKPNSINANFRLHCFKIHIVSMGEITKEIRMIADSSKNFKVRSNLNYNFTYNSTMEQINMIPCDSRSQTQVLRLSFESNSNDHSKMPDFIKNFVSRDNEVYLKTELFYTKIKKNNEWKERFFTLAIREWSSLSPKSLFVDVSVILRAISKDINSPICSNVSFLFNQQTETSSNTDSTITFDAYLKFVARYGFLSACTKHIESLSQPIHFVETENDYDNNNNQHNNNNNNNDRNSNNYYNNSNERDNNCINHENNNITLNNQVDRIINSSANNASLFIRNNIYGNNSVIIDNFEINNNYGFGISDENGSYLPTFRSWFKPSFSESNAMDYLRNMPNNTWIVRPSSSLGKFTLHSKKLRGLLATHVSFDALCAELAFSVEVEGGKELYASSWDELLFGILMLPTQSIREQQRERRADVAGKALYVSASEIVGPDNLLHKTPLALPVSLF